MQSITSLGIKTIDYISKDRLISFHNQMRLISRLGNQVNNILEIGIFNSLLTDLLKRDGYNVTTADIDSKLEPDIILDLATDFSLPNDKFDAIVLFQVLEHLPYEKSETALKKLAACTKKFLVVSLPYCTSYLAIQVKYSLSPRPRYLSINVPKFWSTKPVCDEQHYWEMGLKGYQKKRILNSFASSGLRVKEEFLDPIHPYHYFFVLEKI
jgi:Methyltransferase domain